MALPSSTTSDLQGREDLLVRRLIGLYQEELQVYQQVLELSRQQGQLIRRGASLGDIRRILQQKKQCLDVVGRLEATERNAKRAWDQGRHQWTVQGRTRLHEILGQVGQLIEQILACEEENDRHLIEQTRAG